MKISLSGKWTLAYGENRDVKSFCDGIKTINDVKAHIGAELKAFDAEVPGGFMYELFKHGTEPDPFFGDNSWRYQKYEACHLWYYREFDIEKKEDGVIRFEGLDTYADIYLNGKLIGKSENMMLPCKIALGADAFENGKNEMVVHFTPVTVRSREKRLPAMCNTLFYNYQALYTRKPMHMYGWDIMPRLLDGGIYKDVYIEEKPKSDRIEELFVYTLWTEPENNRAKIRVYFALDVSGDFVSDYHVTVEGKCGDSTFFDECDPYGAEYNRLAFIIENCKLWWQKNGGEQNLYDVSLKLYKNGELLDEKKTRIGIRTVELVRTDTYEDGNGDFCFKVNGRRVFIMGTNWVPLDAFHENDGKRLEKALALLDDVGVNAVRMWGGNLYESDEFFDRCDQLGILVWQDFAMACAVYPRDDDFIKALEPEIIYTVKRLRNHPSLALWAGDNECDQTYQSWGGVIRDPNENTITRKLIPGILQAHDFTRPYLPSSPFISELSFSSGKPSPEQHLWGPRDYYKGDFYKKAECFFASEIGYHGCPSPQSLRKFIGEDFLYPITDGNGEPNVHWLAHATESRSDGEIPYKYRIGLMIKQVKLLFGELPDNISDFARMSQISQAEAFKYFIESFRINKKKRTGIIWWNLLDGWPQASDAVVDYYFCEKLAYKFIKRVQQPVCLILDGDDDGEITLYGVNDGLCDAITQYTVTRLSDGKDVMEGIVTLRRDGSDILGKIYGGSADGMYLITWNTDGKECRNHYYGDLRGADYKQYLKYLEKCGFDEFEGF